jgi:NTP pyrophosphatase (non-canonical NTP hydrolase)|tara:strand:- start:1128 stop:1904 length:777 start_codon:yes stop_codon:yes gene_type:complete
MYYLYHIPGKKIGVTRNLNKRVTEQQGYDPDEYEVLFTSEDIDYISDKEIELQQSYGYKKDLKLYKNLFNKMKINATEQTSTFPCPINKLKGRLLDNVGLKWRTEFGQFEITKQNIPWIMANVKTSMFNENRSYVYNKALYEAFFNPNHNPKEKCLTTNLDCERFDLIRDWAAVRGIYENGDSKTQYVKLQEEAGELAKALLNHDKPEIQDAIGDMIVVLTNLAHLEGLQVEDCIDSAYQEIAARTGKMINGTFVKDE